jgi:hypothetical protein
MPKTLQTSTQIGERPPGHEVSENDQHKWMAAAYPDVEGRAAGETRQLAGCLPNASPTSTVAEAIAFDPPELLARGKRHP